MNVKRSCSYVLPGDPVPLARARSSLRSRSVWDSQKETKVILGIMLQNQSKNEKLLSGPLLLEIMLHIRISPSAIKKKLWKEGDLHFSKPDFSNLLKMLEDVGTGILYRDDCQIAEIQGKKVWSHNPRTEFKLTEL